ncbi:hypothetical protein CRG98_027525 [Punica granatum]|uniref:Uncharacterized protein n=1 Tax=Punica granatum TaxID=22663 RepID=A0A2I0J795_PUNGR|nr:hypothetical protein CRG98_027525 [Punica granatum]
MNYDYRTSAQHPSYRPSPVYGNSMYPRVASQHGQDASAGRPTPSRHTAPLPPLSSSAELGVRVAIKPECRINSPPLLSPQVADIPRSSFQFNFDFERKILAEAEKESQNWSKIAPENVPSRASRSCPSPVRCRTLLSDPAIKPWLKVKSYKQIIIPLSVFESFNIISHLVKGKKHI